MGYRDYVILNFSFKRTNYSMNFIILTHKHNIKKCLNLLINKYSIQVSNLIKIIGL